MATINTPQIIGSIDDETSTRVFTITKNKRNTTMFELNKWLYDYYKERKLPIKQLPPLDDWCMSNKGQDWYILLEKQFLVTLTLA